MEIRALKRRPGPVAGRSVTTVGCAGQRRPKRSLLRSANTHRLGRSSGRRGSSADKTFARSDAPAKTFPESAPRSGFTAAVYGTATAEKLACGLSLQANLAGSGRGGPATARARNRKPVRADVAPPRRRWTRGTGEWRWAWGSPRECDLQAKPRRGHTSSFSSPGR